MIAFPGLPVSSQEDASVSLADALPRLALELGVKSLEFIKAPER